MSGSTKVLDPAFQGAGQKPGTEIWRIENFEAVPIPKSEHGKFYMGDTYIVLQTTQNKGGAYLFDIHFWIGKDTSQDESGTAAVKTVELDAVLGGRAVQHREVQGHESDKFLSYFKPCIIPLEGGVASGFKTPEEEVFETRLYTCKGKRAIRLKQVPFARSSLNHDDVFILDTKEKIFQFNGANSNIQERAKSLEVVQYLKDKYHEGTCDVAIVDDGKLDTESDSGEFWVLFGGFAPIGRKVSNDDDIIPESTPPKLYCITDGQMEPIEGDLSKSMLENTKCYLLDCGAEVFVWVGRVTQVDERKAASQSVEEFLASEKRPKATRVTRVIQGYESHSFKSNFDSWPSGSAAPGNEEGRGKVAALLKQQGVGLKGIAKSAPVNEDIPPLLEGGGKLEVWYVDGKAKTPLPKEDVGKFYSGDCYLVLYTYHSGDRKEDYFLCCWFGKNSIQEDQDTAILLANKMSNTLKGRPVQGRVYEGKEPPQFVALFQPMVVLKGGLSSGYKNSVEEKGSQDETYTPDAIALIQVSGTGVHNNKALQVELVATSLNSYECFLLQSGTSMFLWHGNQSAHELLELAAKVAEFLKPGITLKHAKEGTESSTFWFALGGKQNFTSKKASSETVRDPHLFSFSFNRGKFQIEEIHNFAQDDLLTEDIYILDTHAEVFVWVGQCVDAKEKQTVFEIGQKYVERAGSLEGLSPKVPLYKVTEGNEPSFFTTFFSWDHAKAIVQGNSFQKKAALLFGTHHAVEDKSSGGSQGPRQRAEALAALNNAFNSSTSRTAYSSQDRSNESSQEGPRQRAEALAALNSAFSSSSSSTKSPPPPRPVGTSQASQRAAAVAALSQVLVAENKKSPDTSPTRRSTSSNRSDDSPLTEAKDEADASEEAGHETKEEEEVSPAVEQEETQEPESGVTFSYEQLRAKSENPVTGIDFKRREAYLTEEEFQSVFGMEKEAFNNLPRWKQDLLKKKFDLF
uniref:Villin-2 n=1 Tax=Noccaea caerulescens TaxID=107243 RepID=A0A1J3ISD7_NOCCA